MNEGWVCPKCAKVLAPWIKECNCQIEALPCLIPWPGYPIKPGPTTGDPLPPPSLTVCADGIHKVDCSG